MSRFSMYFVVFAVTALIVALPTALSAESVDRTVDVNPNGDVEITGFAGTLQIVGWDQPVVQVTGSLTGSGIEELIVRENGGDVEIELRLERRNHRIHIHGDEMHGERMPDDWGEAELVISMPRTVEAEIASVSADITIEGMENEFEVSTVSGEIAADRIPSGSEVNSVSGEIDLSRCEVIGGSEISTVSGEILIDGGLQDGESYELNTVSGEIVLVLDGSFGGSVEATSFSGDIKSDFGEGAVRTSKYTPAKELYFDLPGGSSHIELATVSGDLRIRKP